MSGRHILSKGSCKMSDNRSKFLSEFPKIVDDLKQDLTRYGMPSEAVEWYERNLNYNTPGGKLNRGLSVVDTFAILKGTTASQLPLEQYKKLALLGWCIELLQAYFLVADDIMDHSITRRGQPCWYRVEGVNEIAINDAFMLEAAIYRLLRSHFREEPYYIDLVELFHEVTFQTELGQLLDLITAPEDHVDLSKFSMAKHSFIVIFKTAYYSFYLPVALAMYSAGVSDPRDLQQAKSVLTVLGEYFQIQDDYLDCYGTPEQIGKIGTDIQDNKCSWVINKALELANAKQRQVLEENYGRKSIGSEQACKKVFQELHIQQHYLQYEQSISEQLKFMISQIDESRGFKQAVLTTFFNKIYKRSK